MGKEWRDVPGFEGLYYINEQGQVKNAKGKILSARRNGNNVTLIKLRKDGRDYFRSVARLVAEAFLGGVPDDCVVYHKNGMQTDCALENLGIRTKAQQMGLMAGGNRKPVAKVDADGNFLEIYRSGRAAALANNMTPAAVVYYLKKRHKAKGVYSFEYLNHQDKQ